MHIHTMLTDIYTYTYTYHTCLHINTHTNITLTYIYVHTYNTKFTYVIDKNKPMFSNPVVSNPLPAGAMSPVYVHP